VSMNDLRRRIGWVGQTPQLFTGSIADNLYDGDIYRQVSADELRHAIDVANVSEFAIKLPLGINSPVGENGSSLSGGQRQRVSIARALIKNAPILCLDEPTAALDAKSENYVRDSLAEIIGDKTVMMVTHRRSLLALMDTIYVLENGTLTNVNELGGLDYYLQVLEGKSQAQIEAEIADDQNYLVPEVMDQNIGINEAIQTIQQVAPQYQPYDPNNVYDDGDDEDDDEDEDEPETAPSAEQPFGVPSSPQEQPQAPGDDEVVIRLR
jgi:ABC-type lipoprotein export system ATPase subunit